MSKEIKALSPEKDGVWVLDLTSYLRETPQERLRFPDTSLILKQLLPAKAKKLVIDLSNIEQLSSQELQVLLVIHRHLTLHNIQVVLRNPMPHIKRLLWILAFDRVFEVEEKE